MQPPAARHRAPHRRRRLTVERAVCDGQSCLCSAASHGRVSVARDRHHEINGVHAAIPCAAVDADAPHTEPASHQLATAQFAPAAAAADGLLVVVLLLVAAVAASRFEPERHQCTTARDAPAADALLLAVVQLLLAADVCAKPVRHQCAKAQNIPALLSDDDDAAAVVTLMLMLMLSAAAAAAAVAATAVRV